MAGAASGRLSTWFKSVFAREKLDELPEIPGDRSAVSFLSWLLKSERLPADEPEPGGGARLLPWLFGAEELPRDGQGGSPERRSSFLRTLFSRERLPLDPVPDRAAAGRPPRRWPGVRR